MSKVFKVNKRASFDYQILETFKAGLALEGWEVKSIKQGNVSLKEGFVRIRNGEAFLLNVHISPYQKPLAEDKTRRTRKLLLQKRELAYLHRKLQAGMTIIPLKMIGERGLVKLKKKAIKRDIEVAMKERS
jgi:SsrA-binding protein